MEARQVRRVGLIGVGKHGVRYARHIRDDMPDLELVAIARRDPDRAAAQARELGARPYTDYRELIERGGIDAVIAAVPSALNLDIVRCAARAGLPVLLEKPAAPSLAAGRELLATVQEHPMPVMVAQTLRYNAVVRALFSARAEVGALHSLTLTQRFERSVLGWIDDPEQAGGGIVLQTGVHAFDLMRLLSGLEPDSVTCQTQMVHTRHTEDGFVATVRLGGGAALATVSCARNAGARNGHIELSGERGTLIGDHVLNRAYKVVGTTMEVLPLTPAVPTVREVLRDFIGAVRAGAPMPITLADGLRAVAVVDACYASARSGQAVVVETVADAADATHGAA